MARPDFDCTTCDKFHPDQPTKPENGGQCRAHPPVTVIVGAERDRLTNVQRPLFQTIFPVVLPQHYCFEHPMATAKIPIFGSGERAGPAMDLKGLRAAGGRGQGEEPDQATVPRGKS